MPLLFYGPYGEDPKRNLYVPGMRLIETTVFDKFRVSKLAPPHKDRAVANFWWWRSKKHTMFSWHDLELSRKEFTILIPQLLNQRQALELARDEFPEVMPSPIIFRFAQDYDEALSYD